MTTGIDRLAAAFAGGPILVPYLTAGDPDLETTAQLLDACADAGADIIELGVPFSDPMADGPVLQLAAERALRHPVDVGRILAVVAGFVRTPTILFGYYNPFLRYGLERLARDAAAAGVCGVLVVDLPPEEAGPLHAALTAQGLALVPLLTPTSDVGRIAQARTVASAFAYYVSITGVTGAALEDRGDVAHRVADVRAELGLPLVVGFGVRTPSDVAQLARTADGVVVGSALVDLAHRSDAAGRVDAVRGYVASLVGGLLAP